MASLGALLSTIMLVILFGLAGVSAQPLDLLPSWKPSAAKESLLTFHSKTTDRSSASFVSPEQRITTFKQDCTRRGRTADVHAGVYILERVPELAKAKPELAQEEPYARVLCGLAGNRQSFERLKVADLEKLAAASLTGVPLDSFNMGLARWLATAPYAS